MPAMVARRNPTSELDLLRIHRPHGLPATLGRDDLAGARREAAPTRGAVP